MRNHNELRPYRGYPDNMEENQQIGKQLYNQDQHNQPGHSNQPYNRYGTNRGHHTDHERTWDEGNYFHTGPQKHGAQDRYNTGNTFQNYGSQRHTYSPHQEHHYGNDPNSVYRNPNALDYGDNYTSRPRWGSNAGGTAHGTHDYPSVNENPHYEGPGSRSRYKEDDYRYGSGQHNWYLEGRYSRENSEDRDYHHPYNNRRHHEDEGFFDRMGNKISHAWHALTGQEEDEDNRSYQRGYDRTNRRHMHHDQERHFNRGYESGPGWADEHTAIDPYKHRSNADTNRSYYNRRRHDW